MRRTRIAFHLFATIVLGTAFGCSHPYYAPPPPPPAAASPLIQLAERNGFETGRADGARDAYNRLPNEPRRTRAYADTPGYDGRLGPFGSYQNIFREAYLRGYERGYRNLQ